MILLDTHVWIWWVHEDSVHWDLMDSLAYEHDDGEELVVSVISCWEVAKLVERGRLDLKMSVNAWLNGALGLSGIGFIHLSPRIAAEACSLPGDFHRDPADQIIVATSRVHDIRLATADEKIRRYPHVRLFESWTDSSTIHDG